MATTAVWLEWMGPQDKPMPRLRIVPPGAEVDSSPLLITVWADQATLDRAGRLVAEHLLAGEPGEDAVGYLATAELHDRTARSLFPLSEHGLRRLRSLVEVLDPEGRERAASLLARCQGRLETSEPPGSGAADRS